MLTEMRISVRGGGVLASDVVNVAWQATVAALEGITKSRRQGVVRSGVGEGSSNLQSHQTCKTTSL